MTTTTTTTTIIITNRENAIVDFKGTGNDSMYCFDCGEAFTSDNEYVKVGESAPYSCVNPDCGSRCANPNIIGVIAPITGTWKNDEVLGTFFLSDDKEEFHYDTTDEDGEIFFTGVSSRPFCVHIGELLDWNDAGTYNSMSGTLTIGQFVYVRSGFVYAEAYRAGVVPAIVVKEEEGNAVYKRYTCIPIK